MRHRIGCASQTGLGNPLPVKLNNEWSKDKEYNKKIDKMLGNGINLYFKDYEGCDFKITKDRVDFGIEPAYQFEDLKIISINKNIESSFIQTGRAFGYYGSNILSKIRYYKEYKNRSKFVKFIDKWHKVLFRV